MAALATSREQDGTPEGIRQQFGGVQPGSRRAGRIRMLIKIYGGTRRLEARNLCETCRSSRIIRGRRTDEEVVFCSAMAIDPVRIEFKVTSCTDYVDARVPPYHELLEKAWVLTPKTRRRPAGFVKGSDLGPDELPRLMCEPGRRE